MSYWDTSALLKLYVTEEDSPAFLALAAGVQRVMTGFIGKYEARAVFRRREADQVLAAGAADLCYQKLVEHAARGRVEIVPESGLLEHEYGVILNRCLSQTGPHSMRHPGQPHNASMPMKSQFDELAVGLPSLRLSGKPRKALKSRAFFIYGQKPYSARDRRNPEKRCIFGN